MKGLSAALDQQFDRWDLTPAEKEVALLLLKGYGHKDCAIYSDFREVLARPDIDAVMISTPDHWHVPISLAALRTGNSILGHARTNGGVIGEWSRQERT